MNIGVLSLQGAFLKHMHLLKKIGVNPVNVRYKDDLLNLHGLIIPGGESTVLSKLIIKQSLYEPLEKFINKVKNETKIKKPYIEGEFEDIEESIKSNKLEYDSLNSKILSEKEKLFKVDSEIKTITSENDLIKQGLESTKIFKSETVQELEDILIEKEKKQKLLNSTTSNYNKITSDINNKDSSPEAELIF